MILKESFRPQQGLSIMNHVKSLEHEEQYNSYEFPSPTGVKYYELN